MSSSSSWMPSSLSRPPSWPSGLMSVMGLGVTNIIIALAFIGIPHYGRIVRGAVLSIREKEYIEAARASGSGHLKLLLIHVLPNAMAPLIVVTTIGVANAILIEAALSFLGLGVPPPAPPGGTCWPTEEIS